MSQWDFEYNMGNLEALDERLDKMEPTWKVATHPLMEVFDDAVKQAVSGKGNERHGKGSHFMDQPWLSLAQTHGIGFLTGQADKKLKEAVNAYGQEGCTDEWWERELLGAINYIAMAIIYNRETK